MAGLVPAIHVFLIVAAKTWMPGTSPGMTNRKRTRLADGQFQGYSLRCTLPSSSG